MTRMPRIILQTLLLLGVVAMPACNTKPKITGATAVARFLMEADATQAAIDVTLPVSGLRLRIVAKPVITEFDIVRVAEAQVDMGRCLAFQLSSSAARDLYRLSASNLGKRLVLLVNGQPMGARVLDRAIEGGVLFIFVEVPDENLPRLVEDMNHTATLLQEAAAKAR